MPPARPLRPITGQRLPPTYYRGCWHVVSRGFLLRYRQGQRVLTVILFVPYNRTLQPEGRHRSRGVAPSDFRPLRKIPHCCLPVESGPCLSPNVAVHPLRPATDRRLGGPLPLQLANQTQAPPPAKARRPPFFIPSCGGKNVFGISSRFQLLSPSEGQVAYALLTRLPLELIRSKLLINSRSTCMC